MTLKFEKIEAGQYRIAQGSGMIGFVRKQSASKWVMYKCTNLSMLGNPVAVTKTLKDMKVQAEDIFSNYEVPEITEESPELDALLNEVQSAPDKFELMKEMLEKGNLIEFNEYNLEGEQVPFSEFLTEDQAVAI